MTEKDNFSCFAIISLRGFLFRRLLNQVIFVILALDFGWILSFSGWQLTVCFQWQNGADSGLHPLSLPAVFCSGEQQSPEWFWLGLTWDSILSPGPVPPQWMHIATYALNSSVLSPFLRLHHPPLSILQLSSCTLPPSLTLSASFFFCCLLLQVSVDLCS